MLEGFRRVGFPKGGIRFPTAWLFWVKERYAIIFNNSDHDRLSKRELKSELKKKRSNIEIGWQPAYTLE